MVTSDCVEAHFLEDYESDQARDNKPKDSFFDRKKSALVRARARTMHTLSSKTISGSGTPASLSPGLEACFSNLGWDGWGEWALRRGLSITSTGLSLSQRMACSWVKIRSCPSDRSDGKLCDPDDRVMQASCKNQVFTLMIAPGLKYSSHLGHSREETQCRIAPRQ